MKDTISESKALVDAIVAGIQEKKGRAIRIIDLGGISGAICQFFIICQGNTPMQVAAIADSIEETARQRTRQKPLSVDGTRNAHWIAIDYADVVAHVFVPDARQFYDIEHLWGDAQMTDVADDY